MTYQKCTIDLSPELFAERVPEAVFPGATTSFWVYEAAPLEQDAYDESHEEPSPAS